MRIGILTLPLHTNYGGILQAYALQTVLERMGHEVILIEKRIPLKLPVWKMPFSYAKRFIKKFILHKNGIYVFYEKRFNEIYPIISQYTQQFIDSYISYIDIKSFSILNENDFDALIVGSDQVWRPSYFCTMCSKIEDAFLQFAKTWRNVKKIAYAPSFGTDQWEYSKKQTQNCRELVKYFDAISVRELSGVKLCRNYLYVQAEHVLDPTMLLSKSDYIKLISPNFNTQSNFIFQYILDYTDEKIKIIENIAKKCNYNVFNANLIAEDQLLKCNEHIQISVEEWLKGFQEANIIVTDSFHACVFSIIFCKSFIVIGNTERGYARFLSLLSMFDLTDRLVTDIDGATKLINERIEWSKVQRKLDEQRNISLDFLKSKLM